MPDGSFPLAWWKAVTSDRVISTLLGCSLALVLVTTKGFGVSLALLLLVALASIRYTDVADLRRQDRVFLLSINTYPLLVAFSMLIHGLSDVSHFDNASRFLLLGIVYVALRARPFRMSYVVTGAMLGCGLAFCAGLVHLLQGSQVMPGAPGRYVGPENAVVFAQLAFFLLLVAITPARLPVLSEIQNRLLLLAVVLMASGCLVVSQSRWVLLALLALYVYLIVCDRRLPGSGLTRSASLLLPVCAAALLLDTSSLSHLAGTAPELIANVGQIDQRTSLGQRLALWSSSWHLIVEKPLLGHGVGQFRQALNGLPEAASLTSTVRAYSHAHNEYLQMAVEQGLLGLALFIGALAAILRMTLRESFAADARHLLLGAVISWLFFGLTQTQLADQKSTMMFALVLTLGFSHGMNSKYGPLKSNDSQG